MGGRDFYPPFCLCYGHVEKSKLMNNSHAQHMVALYQSIAPQTKNSHYVNVLKTETIVVSADVILLIEIFPCRQDSGI